MADRFLSQFVLGHCDLSSVNLIIPECQDVLQHELDRGINFIGYEFAMLCSASFDIANHLSEWAGFECDYTLLPTRAVRRAFIEQYFHSFNAQSRTSPSSFSRSPISCGSALTPGWKY